METMQETKRELQAWRMQARVDDKTDECFKYKLTVLEADLGNPEPLKPLGAFVLDKSAAAASLGLMLTYMLVLMQFKIAEE